MKAKEDIKVRLHTDPDYICSKRFDCSVKALLERYPNGAPDRIISSSLMITEEDLQQKFNEIVQKLRRIMRINLE